MAKAKKKPTKAKKTSSAKKKSITKSKKKTAAKSTKRKPAKVQAVPKGYTSVTPYLIVANATQAIDFYKKAFGAKEVMRMEKAGGKVGHAELKINDAKIMLADEFPEMNALSPQAFGGTAVSIHLYLKDVDGVVQRALDAGAKLVRPVEDMFYGDRCGTVEDPSGHKWHVSTHIEDVSPREIRKRLDKMAGME